ncbi:hypothetical protein [Achromobacter sp.]|uniref:hypothetical protein n=1 Tax=Achromobacter sp. TaxID=134375 RepID=UPI0028AA1621|nr:hypothetical protein [Achromobacter sp.]
MNQRHITAFLFAALCAAGAAQAQNAVPSTATQEMQFPSREGSLSPPSTLRMTVTPETPPVVIRDTPESQAEFQRCRQVSDRAAVSNAQMQAGLEQCMRELEQRRQQ